MKRIIKKVAIKKDGIEKALSKKDLKILKIKSQEIIEKNPILESSKKKDTIIKKPLIETIKSETSLDIAKNQSIEYPEIDPSRFENGKEAEISREKIKEKEVEDFLRATEESSPLVVVEKTHHYFYLISVSITISILVVFSIYTLFYSQEKKVSISTIQSGEVPINTITKDSVPVENIVIEDSAASYSGQKENKLNLVETSARKDSSMFSSFVYNANTGKQIVLSGTCHDTYYAFLIFDSKIDYRKYPGKALSNKAFSCPGSGSFAITINLKDFNLQSGTYYIFIADQGNSGSWYNPR